MEKFYDENIRIDRSEILKLYESTIGEISPHSIGQWLKSKTDGEYIVIPTERARQIEDCAINITEIFDVHNSLKDVQEDLKNWM